MSAYGITIHLPPLAIDRSRVYRQVWTSEHTYLPTGTLHVVDIPGSALNRDQLSHRAPSHVKNVPNAHPPTHPPRYLISRPRPPEWFSSITLVLLREGTAPNLWKNTSLSCSFSYPQFNLTPDNLSYYASYATPGPRYTQVPQSLICWPRGRTRGC
jgi:hypothetical protein